MSGVFKGKILDFFTGRTLLSKKKHNEVIAAVNPLLNMEVTMGGGQTPSVNYSDTKVQIKIPRQQSSASSSNFHPFQLYEVPTNWKASADQNKKCYAVRSGHVELRPRWDFELSGGFPAFASNNTWRYYDIPGGALGDDVEDEQAAAFGFSGSYFALDDISGILTDPIGGTNWGCYYSFWLEINDSTPNAGPTVAIKCRRVSFGAGNYPLQPFPGEAYDATLYNLVKKEVLPIALLQLVAPDDFTNAEIQGDAGIGVLAPRPGVPLISQIQTTNFVNRYAVGQAKFLGDFDASHYRVYYPGDIVLYAGSGGTDVSAGTYVATAVGQNGGAVTVPTDNASAQFEYLGNTNPPSITNPP